MIVDIDKYSGFCFGVVYAIEMAEEELRKGGDLYCLGDIVHNNKEVDRLTSLGLQIINHDQLKKIKNAKVLIRAHGEPPETYKIALQNNIKLLDASCPVVLKLQHQIKEGYKEVSEINGQIVIFGKKGHAEVEGLMGQIEGDAILVSSMDDLANIDYRKPIYIYSQTTKSLKEFKHLQKEIKIRREDIGIKDPLQFVVNDTLCRQVSGRELQIKKFSTQYDLIIFVSGKKSSNGQMLFKSCKKENPNSYFISDISELEEEWFKSIRSVGVCGATSTPRWLMIAVSEAILEKTSRNSS